MQGPRSTPKGAALEGMWLLQTEYSDALEASGWWDFFFFFVSSVSSIYLPIYRQIFTTNPSIYPSLRT